MQKFLHSFSSNTLPCASTSQIRHLTNCMKTLCNVIVLEQTTVYIKIRKMSAMANRITIVLDEDIIQKLRNIQAKQIKDTSSSVSFSNIVNETLKKCLKN